MLWQRVWAVQAGAQAWFESAYLLEVPVCYFSLKIPRAVFLLTARTLPVPTEVVPSISHHTGKSYVCALVCLTGVNELLQRACASAISTGCFGVAAAVAKMKLALMVVSTL